MKKTTANSRYSAIATGVAGALLATAFTSAFAQDDSLGNMKLRLEALEEKMESSSFNGVSISGSIDPIYIWTSHNKGSFNVADDYTTNASTYENGGFGRILLRLEKTFENGSVWSLGLSTHKGFNGIVDKAKVSFPLSESATFFAGMITDWSGYEYGEPEVNKLITHNLHFDYLAPSFYTGAGVEIAAGDLTHKVMVGNMNKSATSKSDRNSAPVLAYRADWSQGDSDPFSVGYGIGGSAHIGYLENGGDKNRFTLAEIDFYSINGAIEYTGQFAAGKMQRSAYGMGDDGQQKEATWAGVSGQVLYRTSPALALIARADYIKNDSNGGGVFWSNAVATGAGDDLNGFGVPMTWDADSESWVADGTKGVNRFALSIGANYTVNENTQVKFEVRHDWADGKVFGDNYDADLVATDYTKSRNLFGLGVVVSF